MLLAFGVVVVEEVCGGRGLDVWVCQAFAVMNVVYVHVGGLWSYGWYLVI